tara:strand:+ start:4670 stop:5044 length:375 start_codon:yes stop_codon:yes gene_type:complete
MGRPRKLKLTNEATKPTANPGDEKLPPKKRRWKPGGKVAIRKRLGNAQKLKHPVPNAAMRRMLAAASEGNLRWSPAALQIVIELVHAHVHRTLVVTNMVMTHAGKKTLTPKAIKLGEFLAEGNI